MGGSSGVLTANSKSELRKIVRKWYDDAYREYRLYPRIDETDFNRWKKEERKGCELILINSAVGSAAIQIKPMEEFKEYFSIISEAERRKKYGCAVSAHT